MTTDTKDSKAFLKRKQALLKVLLKHKRGIKKISLPPHGRENVDSLLKQVGNIQNIKDLLKVEKKLNVSSDGIARMSVKSKVLDSFKQVVVNPALRIKGRLTLKVSAVKAKVTQSRLVSFFETVKQGYFEQIKSGRKERKRELAYFKRIAKYTSRFPEDVKGYMESRSEGETQSISLFGKLAFVFGAGALLVVGSTVSNMPQLDDVFRPLGLTGEKAESFNIHTGKEPEDVEGDVQFTTVTKRIKGQNINVTLGNSLAVQTQFRNAEHQGDTQLSYLSKYVDGTTKGTLSTGMSVVAASNGDTSTLIANNSDVVRRYPDALMKGRFGSSMSELQKASDDAATHLSESEKAKRELNKSLSYDGSETVTATNTVYSGSAHTPQSVASSTGKSSAVEHLKPMLKQHEGFRSNARWDVNAYRLGYGSDTITNKDGSFRRVRAGDTVTLQQAELDLARRAAESLAGAEKEVGSEHWKRLDPHVQAVLGSLKYNFGSLHNPKGGRGDLVPAIRNGASNEQISAIVRGWQYKGLAANINNKEAAGLRRRRNEEANYILTGGSSSAQVQPVQQLAAVPIKKGRPLQNLQPEPKQKVQKASIKRTVDTTVKATLANTPFMPEDERLVTSVKFAVVA